MAESILLAICLAVLLVLFGVKRYLKMERRRRLFRDLSSEDHYMLYKENPHFFALPNKGQRVDELCPKNCKVGFANQWRSKWNG